MTANTSNRDFLNYDVRLEEINHCFVFKIDTTAIEYEGGTGQFLEPGRHIDTGADVVIPVANGVNDPAS